MFLEAQQLAHVDIYLSALEKGNLSNLLMLASKILMSYSLLYKWIHTLIYHQILNILWSVVHLLLLLSLNTGLFLHEV
jgi:hypothetical protein